MNILQLVKGKLKRIFEKYFKRDKINKFPIFYIYGCQSLPPP